MVAILSLVGLFAYKRLNRNYQAEARRNQDRLARVATEHFQGLWPLRQSQVDEICKRLLHDRGVRLTVIASNGAVLGDSEADPRLMANHRTPDRPEDDCRGGNGPPQRHPLVGAGRHCGCCAARLADQLDMVCATATNH
jgi:hypothetical protein